MRLRPLTLLAASAAALLAMAAPAWAGKDLRVGIADDGVTQREPGLAADVIPQWKGVGVDSARVLVIWGYVAPDIEATKAPAGFDPSNPDDPAYNWAPVDATVDLLVANGIKPVLNITGFGPVWGSQVPSRRNGRYKLDPDKFAAFATAVARRYGPRVDEWIFMNEPNIALWLQPQFDCTGSRCTPASPHQYRRLALKSIPAIRAADPGAQVYGPSLAARGADPTSRNATMRPGAFFRALGCVDGKFRKDRSSANCRGFQPLTLDAIAYQPHGVTRSPTTRNPRADEASIGDLTRLFSWVDRIQRAGGLVNAQGAKKFDFHFTEWAYQTNPPDPYTGVSLAEQARWAQQGAYIAWRAPRVRSLTHYLWRDDPVRVAGEGARAYTGWQSGLYFYDGRKKPLRDVFPNPFWVDLPRGKRTATVWGQVRPGPGGASVTVQRRRGRGAFTTLRTVMTDALGYFSFPATINVPTSLRYTYTGAGGNTVTSATMTVRPR